MRIGTRGTLAASLGLAIGLVAPVAQAGFHLMSIREVYAGSNTNPNSQYVLLQMRAASQKFVSGHSVDVYDAAGNFVSRTTFSNSVLNSVNQEFILVGTTQAAAEFGVPVDLTMPANLSRAGGRVCFESLDCVAWGNYTGPSNRCKTSSGTLTTAVLCETGTPFRATEGIANGRAARRDISRGDPNLLEPASNTPAPDGTLGDDTANSSADFFYTSDPKPTNNAQTTFAPPAIGTGIKLPNFTNTSNLVISSGPVVQAGVLNLTPIETAPAAVSVWHKLRQPVSNGLETTFQFRITPNGGGKSEGFAFVIQNESNSSLGGGGGKLGYDGITNGIAVEFDTRKSSATEIGAADPVGNRIDVHSLGTAANSASQLASLGSVEVANLDDGNVHLARIKYTPRDPVGTLEVFLDNVQFPVIQAFVDLTTELEITRNAAFVGFTSGSGSGVGDNEILDWTLAEDLPDVPTLQIVGGLTVPESRKNVTFSVAIDPPNTKDTIVGLTIGGTATLGSDYNFGPLTVKIPAGETMVTRELSPGKRDIIDDTTPGEGIETIIINLDAATSTLRGAVIGTPASTTFKIRDND